MPRAMMTVLLLLPGVLGCGDDPVSATGRIVIRLSGMNEGDIVGGTLEEMKNISTESGNPYAAFVRDAEAALGREPGRIDVTAVQITLSGDSRGVAGLEEVFTGPVDVFLEADVGGRVAVGRVTNPTGTGPVDCSVVSSSATLDAIRAALLSGSFRVGVSGSTPRTPTDNFDAQIDIGVGFAAYE